MEHEAVVNDATNEEHPDTGCVCPGVAEVLMEVNGDG